MFELAFIGLVDANHAIETTRNDLIGRRMERHGENSAVVTFESGDAFGIRTVMDANFGAGTADRQQLAVGAVRNCMHGAGKAFKLLAQIDVIVGGGATLVIGNPIRAGHAQFATVRHYALLRMASYAHHRFDELVDIVNELTAGSVNQFHSTVAA